MHSCKKIGETEITWQGAREFPVKGEDFGYLIWRKNHAVSFDVMMMQDNGIQKNMCFNLIVLMSLLILSNINALAQQEGLLQKSIHHKTLEAKTYNQIYIFVSFSMPDSALKSYYIEAEQVGARLVMRGLKNNSFLDTKAQADEIGISFDINPNLFEKYQITSVPIVVIDNNQGKVKKLAGHIGLNDALQIMQEEQM